MKAKLFSLVLFSLILISTAAHAQSKKQRRSADLEKAKAEKNYPEALRLINANIDRKPNDEWNYIDRCYLYLEMDKVQDAYLSAEKAMIVNGNNPEVYNALGTVFQTAGDFENAIVQYSNALNATPKDSVKQILAYSLNRATVKINLRRFDEAYADAMSAYALDSNDLAVLNNLAAILDDLGRTDESIRLLKKVISLDPKFTGGYVNLGFQYSKLGQYEKSLEYFDKGIELEPEVGITYNNRGYSKLMLGRLEDALKDVNKSLELYPANSYAFKNRALIYIAMKRPNVACQDLSRALELGFTGMYGDEVENLKKQHCR